MSDSLKLLQFAKKCVEMRRLQKEYFRTKTGLEQCKRIEREVDQEAARIVCGETLGLFDAEVPA